MKQKIDIEWKTIKESRPKNSENKLIQENGSLFPGDIVIGFFSCNYSTGGGKWYRDNGVEIPEEDILQWRDMVELPEKPNSVTEKPSNDSVNHPTHYTHGKFEVIDVIEDWKLDHHRANSVKYIARCNHKGKPVEDLKKAVWYLNRKIELLEKEG